MANLNVLIVDDEPLARKRIHSLLAKHKDIDQITEVAHGQAGVEAIGDQEPDLVFVDIQMPELDGFGMLEKIPNDKMPVFIFVTAYSQHALQAFEAHALDYLLKPFDDERFYQSLDRARELIELKRSGTEQIEVRALLDSMKSNQNIHQNHFAVRTNDKAVVVQAEEIDWIESAANYVRLHVSDQSYLLRETLSGIAKKLNPDLFVRIHRSTIVNLNRIAELHPWSHGDYVVLLGDGQKLKLSRSYRDQLRKRLGNHF